MCRKKKSIAVLLNLLHYFFPRDSMWQTRNFVHREAFEVQHENIPILDVELKRLT